MGATPAHAQSEPTTEESAKAVTPILIVSMDRILRESNSAVAIQQQADALRSRLRSDLAAREEALRAEELELTKLRETLDPERFSQRVADFKEKVRRLKRETNETGAGLQRAVIEANGALKRALQPILLQLMAERRALVMLDEKDVVISATVLDVTQEAVKRLDEAAPDIRVRFPDESGD